MYKSAAIQLVVSILFFVSFSQTTNFTTLYDGGGAFHSPVTTENCTYLLQSKSIAVIQLNNGSPELVDEVYLPSRLKKCIMANNHLYVSTTNDTVYIMELTNPLKPVLAGYWIMPGSDFWLSKDDMIIATVDETENDVLQLYNTSQQPLQPELTGSLTVAMQIIEVHAKDSLLVLLSYKDKYMSIIDIANPGAPVEVYEQFSSDWQDIILGGTFYNDLLLLSKGNFFVQFLFLDLSNPEQPDTVSLSQLSGPLSYPNITVIDDTIYSTKIGWTLHKFEIGNNYAVNKISDEQFFQYNIFKYDNHKYIAGLLGVHSFENMPNGKLRFVDGIVSTGFSKGIYHQPHKIVEVDRSFGLVVNDYIHQNKPEIISHQPYAYYNRLRAKYGKTAFIDRGYDLQLFDFSNPDAPSLRLTITNDEFGDFVIDDTYMYCLKDGALRIYKYNPYLSFQLQSTVSPVSDNGITYVGDGILYTGNTEIQIWDVSDVTNPAMVNTVQTAIQINYVDYIQSDNYLISYNENGFDLFDITDKRNPVSIISNDLDFDQIIDAAIDLPFVYVRDKKMGDPAYPHDIESQIDIFRITDNNEFVKIDSILSEVEQIDCMAADSRLFVKHLDGSYCIYQNNIPTGTEDDGVSLNPDAFELLQNYPNPFNPSTTIKFGLPQAGNVEVVIYNQLGQKVETLISQEMEAGYHELQWNAGQYSSGVYFYSITSGNFKAVKKMLLLK